MVEVARVSIGAELQQRVLSCNGRVHVYRLRVHIRRNLARQVDVRRRDDVEFDGVATRRNAAVVLVGMDAGQRFDLDVVRAGAVALDPRARVNGADHAGERGAVGKEGDAEEVITGRAVEGRERRGRP